LLLMLMLLPLLMQLMLLPLQLLPLLALRTCVLWLWVVRETLRHKLLGWRGQK